MKSNGLEIIVNGVDISQDIIEWISEGILAKEPMKKMVSLTYHKKYNKKKSCRNGHVLTKENTRKRYDKDGVYTTCLDCEGIRKKKHLRQQRLKKEINMLRKQNSSLRKKRKR